MGALTADDSLRPRLQNEAPLPTVGGLAANLPERLRCRDPKREQAAYHVRVAGQGRTRTCGYGSGGGSSLAVSEETSVAHPRLAPSVAERDENPSPK